MLTSDDADATSSQQRTIREALDAARRTNDERQRRALDLQRKLRCEQQAVAQRRRQIQEAEEQLGRWRLGMSESEARLAEVQRELAALEREVHDADRLLTASPRVPALVASISPLRHRSGLAA